MMFRSIIVIQRKPSTYSRCSSELILLVLIGLDNLLVHYFGGVSSK